MVDEVFLNLPSEEYEIGEYVSQFETMGIDVTVNLNAFDLNFAGNKRIREVAGLNVVTFSTNFYKPSQRDRETRDWYLWFLGRLAPLWLGSDCIGTFDS